MIIINGSHFNHTRLILYLLPEILNVSTELNFWTILCFTLPCNGSSLASSRSFKTSCTCLELSRIPDSHPLTIYGVIIANIYSWIDLDLVGSVTIFNAKQGSITKCAVDNLFGDELSKLTKVVDHPIIPGVGVQPPQGQDHLPLPCWLHIDSPNS